MQKPRECDGCQLVKLGSGFSLHEGKPRLGVRFVGEALDRHGAQEGKPMRPNSESGSLITKIIEDLTITDPETNKARKATRGDFEWDNIVKCQPPGDLVGANYEKAAIEHCRIHSGRSYGNTLVSSGLTNIIVALGGVALRELVGIEGKKRGIEDVRGYVFWSEYYHAWVIGSLHPSFIRHGNSRFTSALSYDIKKAILIASGKYRSFAGHADYKRPLFVTQGKLEALVSLYYKLRDNPQLTIYYDIENPYTKTEEEEDKGEEEEEAKEGLQGTEITSIQFAYSKDWAITVPWEKPFIKVAIAILALSNDKVGANVWHHDNRRLEANGANINGTIHDLMWAWKHVQPGLWKGLQKIASFHDFPYAWKHLALEGGNEDEYGCSDVIAPAYIWEKLPQKMKALGVWDSYLKFKVKYEFKVIKPMERRGLFVDPQEHEEFKEWVTKEVEVEDRNLQTNIPHELRNIEPKVRNKETGIVRFGFVKEPPAIRELRGGYSATRAKLEARGIPSSSIISFERYAASKTGLEFREFERIRRANTSQLDLLTEGEEETVSRWCRVLPFKASAEQLIRYLKFKGYKVPRTLKTKRETTGKKELQELWERTGDELLGSTVRSRSYRKMLTNDIPNWLPDSDGLVRTTFKFDPPSWQLNSSNPNIQNASKHPKEWELFGKTASELVLIGQRFRRIVKAPKGRCVVEFDKTAFHVTMMGFEARCAQYIKWSPYMHTLFASYIVGDPIRLEGEIDKDKLSYIKKKFKVVRDSQAKPTVLGNQLGLGSHKLFWMNRTYIDEDGIRQGGIESIKRAKYLQEMLASLFPKVEIYKRKIKEEAHYRKHLKSHFGAIRWFHDVLRWDYRSRSFKNGSEAEEAQSHNLHGDAFGHMHSYVMDIDDELPEFLEEHHYANTIHDSIILFPETSRRDECIETVVRYLRRPDPVLVDSVCPDGLVVDVEVMCSPNGGNWASYKKGWNEMGIQEVKV